MKLKPFTGKPVGNRSAIASSVSMESEDWKYVHERVGTLHPRVKDRSHYFQLMVAYERKNPGLFGDILKSL